MPVHAASSQFENNYFTEMCSGSETGSYLRLIDFVYHSTLGLKVIKKNNSTGTHVRYIEYTDSGHVTPRTPGSNVKLGPLYMYCSCLVCALNVLYGF